tara:strand:+ start:512 stop:871 length:360 start_codon:yes stop_codon:yes gene_type:complete
MGLDMYAIRRAPRISNDLHYWRKHNRLHGWMEQLWREKTGNESVFNNEEVTLELEDISNLEEVILSKELPETEGFFFGMDSYEYTKKELKEQEEDDLQFIEEAKQAIEEGDEVVYSSWW